MPPVFINDINDAIIDDILVPDLAVVFCGMAAGPKSARQKTPYIGPNNKFWPTLKAIGLIPAEFQPQDFRDLPRFGIGLTDVAKTQWGVDSKITVTARDVQRLQAAVRRVRPRRLAFVGKTAASHFFGCATKDLMLGPQAALWEGAAVFVLCSTSARAHPHWRPECWQALAADMRNDSGRDGIAVRPTKGALRRDHSLSASCRSQGLP